MIATFGRIVESVTIDLELFILNGKAQAHTEQGGYPLMYVSQSGELLCPDCVTRYWQEDEYHPEEGDPIVALYPHMEGEAVACDDCGEYTESAYDVPV